MGQKIANAPLGSFTVKSIFSGDSGSVEAIQEVATGSLLTLRTDEGATYMYIGEALPGSDPADDVWRLKRLTLANNFILWADGDTNFDNIWDNRAILTYI